MRNTIRYSCLLLFVLCAFNSCRKEEFAFVGEPLQERLQPNTNVTNLLQRLSLNDGSLDNIIDGASCIAVQLPVTVQVNGITVLVNNAEDYDDIETIFEESEEDMDTLEIQFPITIIYEDFTEMDIATQTELDEVIANCGGENEEDADIECADIQYPVTLSLFNPNSERTETIRLNTDRDLYDFINDLDQADIVNLNFPIIVILSDASQMTAMDLDDLERIIDMAKDDCDEDDDNNFSDDNCEDCMTDQFLAAWATCTQWEAHKFEIGGEDRDELYEDLLFNFMDDGTVAANSPTETRLGTWSAHGIGNMVTFTLDIPGLDDFNRTWNLEEIKEKSSNKIDVRLFLGDAELHIQSTCTDGDPGNNNGVDTNAVLIDGSWEVSSFFDAAIDRTTDFNGYTLNFNADGTLVASNGSPTNGTWVVQTGNTRLLLDLGAAMPLNQLNVNWKIDSVSNTQIELRETIDVNMTNILILTKQ